jgi:hypothetical protein
VTGTEALSRTERPASPRARATFVGALEANDERTSAGQRASRRNDDARSVIGYAPSESERDARCEARARAPDAFPYSLPAPT